MFSFTSSRDRVRKLLGDGSLPLPAPFDSKRRNRFTSLPKRYARFLAFGGCLLVFSLFYLVNIVRRTDDKVWAVDAERLGRLPPLFGEYHKKELALPQHQQHQPEPDGDDRKYFWPANHAWQSGFNNILQEYFLNSYVAYSSKRALVFDNYTWNRDGSKYSDYNGKKIPSQIPYSALIAGPMAGGPMPLGSGAPRFVQKEFFDQVCPEGSRTILRSEEVPYAMGEATAAEAVQAWVDKLNSMPDKCVEVYVDTAQAFTFWLFGDERVQDVFPGLAKSPILADFGWSPLILRGYEYNRHLFTPQSSSRLSWFDTPSELFVSDIDQRAIVPGLLALHIRRGDFESHCPHLGRYSAKFHGFNSFPSLPDKFTPPAGEKEPEKEAIYIQRCYPSIKQIVERIGVVRRSSAAQGLRNIHIMTNGKKDWIEELKKALHAAQDWDKISSSRDMKLTWEQKYVAQAIDMLIGQKAQVFIGNGFSSMTSNIVIQRMAHNLDPESTRYW